MTSYSTVQKQQLSQLGAYLQEKRQEQGKSLEDISLQTYIRAQLLKAVETGDTSDLPQPIFVQGFIRRYADALGLDGTNFSKQFPVHSIPNTPRPVPRPAAQVDMSYQNIDQKPPIPAAKEPSPEIGALPIKSEPTPVMGSVGVPEKATSAQATAEEIAPAQPVTSPPKDFTLDPGPLDPGPMDDSELASLGIKHNTLGDGIATQAQDSKPLQSSPFTPTPEETDPSLSKAAPPPSPSAPEELASVGAMPVEPAEPIASSLVNDTTSSGVNWLPLGIGAAVLVGAIALIGPRIIGGGSNQQPETAETTTTEPEIIAQTAPEIEAVPDSEPDPEPATSDAPVNLQVEITEAGPSWMSIVVDGELAFEGLMDPGTSETWEGQTSITMNVGNAGAALISANGSEPKPAGNPGGAEFLTFEVAAE
ncbi:DUF4115 domain-containing protein [Leptolyngbyaceae cyanobacterium CCMR0082]|uniref:DUF4115 domain-containing protein n=1 Tax=Adonisia turfae CCMR0082 TaxID=2304604 RepID=A0A6M0SFZ9_9CYAN|nr:DUF4115 domain-containing protein [Adonisia turfae CCMR0082]